MRTKFRFGKKKTVKTEKRLPKCKFRFKHYEVGWTYAFIERRKKVIGLFSKRSKVFKRKVKLFIQNPKTLKYEAKFVPHVAILTDPWASVTTVPRKGIPACITFKKESRCLRKYGKGKGQSPYRGTKVKTLKSTY